MSCSFLLFISSSRECSSKTNFLEREGEEKPYIRRKGVVVNYHLFFALASKAYELQLFVEQSGGP
jgi:hypothetical protein